MPLVQFPFDLTTNEPLDIRVTATNSIHRESIQFKYDGLKVFQRDSRRIYTWDETGATWSADPVGNIGGYGTAGYIPKWEDETNVNNSIIYTEESSPGRGKLGINADVSPGEELFATIQIESVNGSTHPFVIDKENITTIGENWYYDGDDKVFNNDSPSYKIEFGDNLKFYLRDGGQLPTDFIENLTLGTSSFVINENIGLSVKSITYSLIDYTANESDFFINIPQTKILTLPDISSVGEGKIYLLSVSQVDIGALSKNFQITSSDLINYGETQSNTITTESGHSYLIRSSNNIWYVSKILDRDVLNSLILGDSWTSTDKQKSLLKLWVAKYDSGSYPSYSSMDFIGISQSGSALDLSSIRTSDRGIVSIYSINNYPNGSLTEKIQFSTISTIFTSTASVSRDLGIKFTGTTGSSDSGVLDDYKEGTWIPSIGVVAATPTITYTTQVGTYTKIGRFLQVNGRLKFIIGAGVSLTNLTYLDISNLPYIITSTSQAIGVWSANNVDQQSTSSKYFYMSASTPPYPPYNGVVLLDSDKVYLSSDNIVYGPLSGNLGSSYTISFDFRLPLTS